MAEHEREGESRRWPSELRVSKDRRHLTVTFNDDSVFVVPAELLRIASPSAEVQGHAPEQRVTVPGKRQVEILKMHPIGSYAVRIAFDDLHDTGIFTWDYLHELGLNRDERMAAYEAELSEKGLSRDPARPSK